MGTREALLDRLPPPLHSLQSAFRTRHFDRVTTRDLIAAAEYLSRIFDATASPTALRPIAAGMLVLLYHLVDGRLLRAPLGPGALPQLDGVAWRRGSPLAGLVDDIPPFMMLDVWLCSVDHHVRERHLARRRPVRPPANRPTVGGMLPPAPLPMNRPVVAGALPTVPDRAQIESVIQQPEFHDMSAGDWLGRGLDIGSFGLSCLAWVGEAMEWVVAGFVADALGAGISAISGLLALPLAWAASDRVWAYNNTGWAYCTSLNDMALHFRNENPSTPERWPQLRLPLEPVYPTGNTAADQVARRALREGFDLAVNSIQRLEHSPRVVDFQVHGQPMQVALTGRRLLFLLNVTARARHERVLDYLRGVVERRANQRMDIMNWGN